MAHRQIDQIVVHCSASAFGNADLIRKWHVDGNGWDDIGYHYVINNGRPVSAGQYHEEWDGYLETGRKLDTPGAHVRGHNSYSLGICMIGEGAGLFTPRQTIVLADLIRLLQHTFHVSRENILGHHDLDSSKECPGFNVQSWLT